jgi:hypothetical protein
MPANDLEKELQQKMLGLKLDPSGTVWDRVEEQIKQKKKRRRFIFWLWLFPLLSVSGYVMYLQVNKQPNPGKLATAQVKAAAEKNIVSHVGKQPEPKQLTVIKNNDDTAIAFNGMQKAIAAVSNNTRLPVKKYEAEKNIAGATYLLPGNKPTENIAGIATIYKKQKSKKTKNNIATGNKTAEEITWLKIPNTISGNDTAHVIVAKEVPVAENTFSEKNTVAKQANADSAVTLLQIKKDSISQQAVTIKKAKKKTGLKFEIVSRVGFSGISDGGFLSGLTQNKSAADAGLNASYVYALPPVASQVITPAQPERGLNLTTGFNISSQLSKKISFKTGLQYSFYSTYIKVGSRIETSVASLAISNTAYVRQFYTNNIISNNNYTNRYHFIELPLLLQWRINKNLQKPFTLNSGINISQLVATNALYYNKVANIYYEDKNAFNKTHVAVETYAGFTLFANKKFAVAAGPYIRYGIDNLVKKQANGSGHLVAAGLQLNVLLKNK